MLTSLITDKNDHTLHGGKIMVLSIQAFMNSAECMRPLHLMFTNVHLFCLVKRPRIDESVSLCICLLTVRGVCLFIRFGEIEISEWVPSEEFVSSSDLEKLRSVNGCRQRSLFVHQIWRN